MAKRDLGKLGVTALEQLERPLPPGIRCQVKLALRRDDDGNEYNRVKTFEVVGIDEPESDAFAPADGHPLGPGRHGNPKPPTDRQGAKMTTSDFRFGFRIVGRLRSAPAGGRRRRLRRLCRLRPESRVPPGSLLFGFPVRRRLRRPPEGDRLDGRLRRGRAGRRGSGGILTPKNCTMPTRTPGRWPLSWWNATPWNRANCCFSSREARAFTSACPPRLWSPAPSADFHRTARRFAEQLAELAAVTIDAGVYDKVRAFRAPNSRHPKTGFTNAG